MKLKNLVYSLPIHLDAFSLKRKCCEEFHSFKILTNILPCGLWLVHYSYLQQVWILCQTNLVFEFWISLSTSHIYIGIPIWVICGTIKFYVPVPFLENRHDLWGEPIQSTFLFTSGIMCEKFSFAFSSVPFVASII